MQDSYNMTHHTYRDIKTQKGRFVIHAEPNC